MKNMFLGLGLRLQSSMLGLPTAFGDDKVTVGQVDPDAAAGSILGLIFWAVAILGTGAILWGGVEFAQTLSEPNGDKRNMAIMKIVGGIVMVGLKVFLTKQGIVS